MEARLLGLGYGVVSSPGPNVGEVPDRREAGRALRRSGCSHIASFFP